MQIRCYRCNNNYSLKKDEIGFALAALREAGTTHYDAPCSKCRTKNRVSLEQLEAEVASRGIEVPDLSTGEEEESEG